MQPKETLKNQTPMRITPPSAMRMLIWCVFCFSSLRMYLWFFLDLHDMTNSRNHNDSYWCFFCLPSGSNSQLPTKPTKRSFLLSSHESTSAMAMLMPFLLKFVGIFWGNLVRRCSQDFHLESGYLIFKWWFGTCFFLRPKVCIDDPIWRRSHSFQAKITNWEMCV